MIFGPKVKHRLPKFPAEVQKIFRACCEALPPDSVSAILKELDECAEELDRKAAADSRIDVKLAEKLDSVSRELLSRYEEFDEEARSLIIGAIRYFAVSDDPVPDDEFASGFVDDAKVMNHVLERIGEEDLIIKI